MRHIEKEDTPAFFEKYKEDYYNNNGMACKFRDMSKAQVDEYYTLKFQILEEQFGLCCYCLKEIDMNEGSCHIEHFIPICKSPDKDMDYKNMLVSCDGFKNKSENCGHKKNNWYIEALTVSPFDPDCESRFKYDPYGNITSAKDNDTGAKETIKELELNSYLLQKARQRAIYISGVCEETFGEEMRCEAIQYYSEHYEGRLPEFCSAVLYCLNNL